jgi:hypothetical protein
MKRWTKDEIKFIEDNYNSMRSGEIAKILGRSVQAIQHKAHRLRLLKKEPPWTNEDLRVLRKNYYSKGAEWVAKKLNRSLQSIHTKVFKMDVVKIFKTQSKEDALRNTIVCLVDVAKILRGANNQEKALQLEEQAKKIEKEFSEFLT